MGGTLDRRFAVRDPSKDNLLGLEFPGDLWSDSLLQPPNHIINNFLPFAWEQSVTTKQVTLRCVSNFVRNINSTYCSKGNMECLPSSCEKSLSKNCASLLYIESLPRTEPVHPTSEETTGVMPDLTPPMASILGD